VGLDLRKGEIGCQLIPQFSEAAAEHTYSYYEQLLAVQQEGLVMSFVSSADFAYSPASLA
jgi:hypothetical protein